MQLYYEGVDITAEVDVTKCIHRDVSGGRSDCTEIEFEHAAAWYRWQPKRDDKIRIVQGNYDTGTLYVNTMLPEQGKYRILATSRPGSSRKKAWASYEKWTLESIMRVCAAECGMTHGLFGIAGSHLYPYLIRHDEGGAAFCERLLRLEGGVLKCLNGRMTGIGIEYAQSLRATQTVELDSTTLQARYIRRDEKRCSGVTIRTPYAKATAYDTAAQGSNHPVLTHLPALDAAQAGRWARGWLMHNNRRAEELIISMEFNAGLTAMARLDVNSATDAAGAWLVDEAEHDLIRGRSTASLRRCITTIR